MAVAPMGPVPSAGYAAYVPPPSDAAFGEYDDAE